MDSTLDIKHTQVRLLTLLTDRLVHLRDEKWESARLHELTGLTYSECEKLSEQASSDDNSAAETIRVFMESLAGTAAAKEAIGQAIQNAGVYRELASNLSSYNTMRGGVNGFKGFVFEEVHAANATVTGQVTEVLANNGIADFSILNADGSVTLAQAKMGYGTTSVDWSQYQGQTIVIDKGNQALIDSARKSGKTVIESNISEQEAKSLAKAMQLETKVTGKTNSVAVPKVYTAGKIVEQCNASGLKAARTGAAFGAGLSIGSNLVELMDGEKDAKEVATAVAKDTAVAAVTSYAVGATTTAIGSTAVGAAAMSAASTAAATVGTAVAGTTIGGAAIAAGTAVTTTAAAAGTAIAGAATAAGTAIAGSAVGTAVAGAATAAGSAIAGSAIGTAAAAAGTAIAGTAVGGAAIAAGAAVTAAAVAAAPVVAAGVVIGGGVALVRKWIRGY